MDSEELIFNSFTDPEVQELVQKITVTLDDEVQQYLADHSTHFCAARVVITTHDGNIYERWMPVPLGYRKTPFGWNMLEQKFNQFLAGTPFDGAKKERFKLIQHLENLNHVDKPLCTQAT